MRYLPKYLFGALALGCLSACASEDLPPDREDFKRVSQEQVVCPGANTVEGVDVSTYQAGFDFKAAKAKGKQFAIIRASHGLNTLDAQFDTFYPQVKAAGMVRGVYQYFEPTQDAVAQADLLLKRIGGKLEAGDLPPTIDVEVKGTTGAMVKAWLNRVESVLGVKPMIYTGYYFWRDNVGDPPGFGGYPLWVAGYVSCPSITDQWSK